MFKEGVYSQSDRHCCRVRCQFWKQFCSSLMKSSRVAFLKPYLVKNAQRPLEKFYSPINNSNCFSVEAPLQQVIPSKIDKATMVFSTLPAIGCVVEYWSSWQPLAFLARNAAMLDSYLIVFRLSLIFSRQKWLINSAKLSLSQRSSHHFIVLRFPNQWCDSSCEIVLAKSSMVSTDTAYFQMYRSLKVTIPAFSMAPILYSWANTWSYLLKGYGTPKNYSKNFMHSIVISKMKGAIFSRQGYRDSMQKRDMGMFQVNLEVLCRFILARAACKHPPRNSTGKQGAFSWAGTRVGCPKHLERTFQGFPYSLCLFCLHMWRCRTSPQKLAPRQRVLSPSLWAQQWTTPSLP